MTEKQIFKWFSELPEYPDYVEAIGEYNKDLGYAGPEDSIQGFYITHPESFRGRWNDECIDELIDLIPETATQDLEFIPTAKEI